jgi:hypothetical protein
MKTISLAKRLIGAVVLSQLSLAVALVMLASLYCFHYLQSAFDVNLEGHALRVASLVHYAGDSHGGLLFDAAKIPPAHHVIHKDIYLVRSDRGDVVGHAGEDDVKFFERIPALGLYWNFDQ